MYDDSIFFCFIHQRLVGVIYCAQMDDAEVTARKVATLGSVPPDRISRDGFQFLDACLRQPQHVVRLDTPEFQSMENVRNVQFFERLASGANLIKSVASGYLDQCENQLRHLPLKTLLHIRLIQPEITNAPESLQKHMRFIEAIEQAIQSKLVDYAASITHLEESSENNDSCVKKDPLLELLLFNSTQRHGQQPRYNSTAALVNAAKRQLGLEIVMLMGVAVSLWNEMHGGKRSEPYPIDSLPSLASAWWRFVFPISTQLLPSEDVPLCPPAPFDPARTTPPSFVPPSTTSLFRRIGRTIPPLNVVGPSSSNRLPSADIRRTERSFAKVRSQSADAINREFLKAGTHLLNVFVKFPDLYITTRRPKHAVIRVCQNADWVECQTLGRSASASRANGIYRIQRHATLHVFELPPGSSFDRFIRPTDAASALRRELHGAVLLRAATVDEKQQQSFVSDCQNSDALPCSAVLAEKLETNAPADAPARLSARLPSTCASALQQKRLSVQQQEQRMQDDVQHRNVRHHDRPCIRRTLRETAPQQEETDSLENNEERTTSTATSSETLPDDRHQDKPRFAETDTLDRRSGSKTLHCAPPSLPRTVLPPSVFPSISNQGFQRLHCSTSAAAAKEPRIKTFHVSSSKNTPQTLKISTDQRSSTTAAVSCSKTRYRNTFACVNSAVQLPTYAASGNTSATLLSHPTTTSGFSSNRAAKPNDGICTPVLSKRPMTTHKQLASLSFLPKNVLHEDATEKKKNPAASTTASRLTSALPRLANLNALWRQQQSQQLQPRRSSVEGKPATVFHRSVETAKTPERHNTRGKESTTKFSPTLQLETQKLKTCTSANTKKSPPVQLHIPRRSKRNSFSASLQGLPKPSLHYPIPSTPVLPHQEKREPVFKEASPVTKKPQSIRNQKNTEREHSNADKRTTPPLTVKMPVR